MYILVQCWDNEVSFLAQDLELLNLKGPLEKRLKESCSFEEETDDEVLKENNKWMNGVVNHVFNKENILSCTQPCAKNFIFDDEEESFYIINLGATNASD